MPTILILGALGDIKSVTLTFYDDHEMCAVLDKKLS